MFQMCFNCKLQGYLLKLIGIITSCNSEWHIKESEGMFVTWLDEAKGDKKIAKQSAKPIILWRKVISLKRKLHNCKDYILCVARKVVNCLQNKRKS